MVLTTSNTTDTQLIAPDFALLNPKTLGPTTLASVQGSHGTVVCFICNHCPFVHHVNDTLRTLARDMMPRGIGFVGISSNDAVAYPQDGPAHMAEVEYPFAYLYDASQATAKAYGAVCTPDFFVFDRDLALVYRGRLDGSNPSQGIADGNEMRTALEALLSENPLPTAKPSIGCSIKWRA